MKERMIWLAIDFAALVLVPTLTLFTYRWIIKKVRLKRWEARQY